jgi:AcrR family transcriptional regulator
VNPALVHYYFGTKEELHGAILEQVATELRERIETLVSVNGPVPDRLRDLVRTWVRAVADDPYLPRMIVQEVLMPEGDRLERFAARFAAPLAERVLGVVEVGVRTGELRPLRLSFVPPSIAGLVVFFFLAGPLVRKVFGVDPTAPEIVEAWADHAADLLLYGVVAPEQGNR